MIHTNRTEILFGHPGYRDATRFYHPVIYVDSIDDFITNFNYTSSSYSLVSGPTSIDFELHFKKSRPETLIVFLGGAKVEPDYGKPGPFFLGRKFSKSLVANCLFISDPAFQFDPDIKLGWYIGVKGCSAQSEILRLIKAVANLAKAKNIIFFGGSGGGYASLYFSYYFPNSLALIWNPQTNILAYGSGDESNPNYHVLQETSKLAFGCESGELSKYAITDVSSLYINSPTNRVLYLQNKTDRHVNEHLIPFLNNIGIDQLPKNSCEWLNDWLCLCIHDKAKRHSPPSKEILFSLLSSVSEPSIFESKKHLALAAIKALA